MRDSYDVVVIGGGHNGLVAAIELARGGFSVCVVEADARVGGCAKTSEPLLPGFKHSPHANCLLFSELQPKRFAPPALGVEAFRPDAQLGIAFADGRPPVILHREELQGQTRASMAVYSKADAERYWVMKRRAARLGPLLKEGLFSAPSKAWFHRQRDVVARAFHPLVDERSLGTGTARQLIDELFKSPEIRILLYVLALDTGVGLEEAGSDLAFLGYSLWIAGRWKVPIGGMQAYSDALSVTAQAAGVDIRVSTPIRSVRCSDGRANGVQSVDGTEIGATVAVIAAIPILSLFDDLLKNAPVSAAEKNELETFRKSSAPTIGTSIFCLAQEPRYKSGTHDPQINRCLKTAIGFATPADVIAHGRNIQRGLLPGVSGVVRVHSLWDATLAPPNHHIAAIDSNFPATTALDASTWQQVQAAFPVALFEAWKSHLIDEMPVPPMATELDASSGFERRMLLRFGSDQYRASIPGLYLAGPGIYPGGGVHGAPGHNVAAIIMRDSPKGT